MASRIAVDESRRIYLDLRQYLSLSPLLSFFAHTDTRLCWNKSFCPPSCLNQVPVSNGSDPGTLVNDYISSKIIWIEKTLDGLNHEINVCTPLYVLHFFPRFLNSYLNFHCSFLSERSVFTEISTFPVK